MFLLLLIYFFKENFWILVSYKNINPWGKNFGVIGDAKDWMKKNYAISTLVVTTLPSIVVKKNMWKTLGSLILGSINDKLSLWFWVLVFLRLAINAK